MCSVIEKRIGFAAVIKGADHLNLIEIIGDSQMEQHILNLMSGVIGAILGAYMAIKINSANRKIAGVEKMLSLVCPIGFKSWWNLDEGKPALNFMKTIPSFGVRMLYCSAPMKSGPLG